MRFSLLILLGFFAISSSTLGQDAVSANSNEVKIAFENDQIRVLHARYAAHEKIPMHSHPARVIVCVTAMRVLTTFANGQAQETTCKPGDSRWSEAVTHSVENLEDAPFEVVEIELKQSSATAVTIPAPSPSTQPLTEPVPVEREPHHHFAFQNQYVRVLHVFFPVGETSLFHTHSNDNVSVAISGDKMNSQPLGGDWTEPQDVHVGEVGFHKARGQAYTHRVRSAGQLPFDVIDIEIFPEK